AFVYIDVQAPISQWRTRLQTLMLGIEVATAITPIVATRVGTGGPGYTMQLDFQHGIRLRGDLPEMIVTSHNVTVTHAQLVSTAVTVLPGTVRNGSFLAGTFALQ